MENNKQMMLAIFAIVAGLGLLGVVAITIVTISEEASAAKPPVKGCRNSLAANASQGRCIQG
jgi:hypothetical protein